MGDRTDWSQRSEEPVSRSTVNGTGGVPMWICACWCGSGCVRAVRTEMQRA